MKHLLFIAGLLGLVSLSYGRARNKVDADFGFNDMKLASAIGTHPEMIYTGLGWDNNPHLRYYKRRSEKLAFEGVSLKKRALCLLQGQASLHSTANGCWA